MIFIITNHTGQEIVFGIVFNPITEELWTARKGKGAFYNGKQVYIYILIISTTKSNILRSKFPVVKN